MGEKKRKTNTISAIHFLGDTCGLCSTMGCTIFVATVCQNDTGSWEAKSETMASNDANGFNA